MNTSNNLDFIYGDTWQWLFTAATPNNVNLDAVDIRWRLYNDDKVLIELSFSDGITIIDSNQRLCSLEVTRKHQVDMGLTLTRAGLFLRHETKLIFADGSTSIQCPGQLLLRYGSFLLQNILKASLVIGSFTSIATLA